MYSMTEDSALVRSAADGVLANDMSADGRPLTASVVTPPPSGGLTFAADGSFTFVPAAHFNGTIGFEYSASNDLGASTASTAVTIMVTPVNDPPTATDDRIEAVSGVEQRVDVLANDSISPDEGEVLRVVAVDSVNQGGSASVSSDGLAIIYQPLATFVGVETFSYSIDDGDPSSTDRAQVVARVRAPTVEPDAGAPDLGPADLGGTDLGASFDAALDAGTASPDTGTVASDAGASSGGGTETSGDSGCRCLEPTGSIPFWVVLVGLGLLPRRRRENLSA